MTLDEIPDTLRPTLPVAPFLTVIPERAPRERTHATLSRAKAAVAARRRYAGYWTADEGYVHAYRYPAAAIYRLGPDGWEPLYVTDQGAGVLPWKAAS